MTGRARGRAVGRARGRAVPQQQQAAPCPAPRQPPQRQKKPPAAGAQATTGTGRAIPTGGARDTRPGASAALPTDSMAGLSLAGQGDHRRRRDDIEPTIRTRPESLTTKQGTSGVEIQVVSNYFRMNQAPDWMLYQYHVAFSPEIDSKSVKMRLVKEQREILGKTRAFDGTVLFLAKRLPETRTELCGVRKYDNAQIKLTFTLTAELPPDSPMCIHIYNVIFRRVLNMIDMEQVGRHYYNPKQGVKIPQHKLEVWPGFITSILQYETAVMLCTDISHKVLRSDTMLDVLYELYNDCRGNSFHDEFQKKYLGAIVITPYNNRTYRIDDVDWSKNPSFKFKMRDGTDMSLTAYYKQQYNLDVTDMNQPLFVSQPKKKDERSGQDGPILLIPELCRLTGLSDEVRSDFHVMKDLAEHTRVSPQERHVKLSAFNKTIADNQEAREELAGWRLGFDNSLVNITGRVLPKEAIIHRDGTCSYKAEEADWSRESRSRQLISCKDLPNESWLLLVTGRDKQPAHDFWTTLRAVGAPMGLNIGHPTIVELERDNASIYDQVLECNIKADTRMVVCVVPNNRKDRYDAIKKRCCLRNPVPSQVIVSRTLSKKQQLLSVATKIAIQMNCKLGGEVWAVQVPLKGLMVVGINSYHDSAKKGRSVGAFVASTNHNLTQYYSRCNFQTNTQELIDGLGVNMLAALKHYNMMNGALPTKIIVYRDGVGDGQLPTIMEHEIPQLRSCFARIAGQYDPPLAVVIVKKRIQTRFFAKGSGGPLANPPPGTVIDSEVTRPEWYDFFLVSQSVRQGTVTPTHYNVVWDTMSLGADIMQRMTYKLTHLYYNWPGTIRVPAPCLYAHKLAFLVGTSLHEDANKPELCDKLFYL